jgi:hypothetical protein
MTTIPDSLDAVYYSPEVLDTDTLRLVVTKENDTLELAQKLEPSHSFPLHDL